jgi:DNA-binding LacI/PurR family transcriptional regulator|tara:strand:+ start:1645 stop:2184 length:540 start_codon:yes stop_codon:yes gene_type:complete
VINTPKDSSDSPLRSKTIGILTHPDRGSFPEHDDIILGAHLAAMTRFCRIIWASDYRLLPQGSIDGLLLHRPESQPTEVISWCRSLNIPWFVFPGSTEIKVPTFSWNNAQGIELIIDHLISIGHKRIGFVSGEESDPENIARYEAYRAQDIFETVVRDLAQVRLDYAPFLREDPRSATA